MMSLDLIVTVDTSIAHVAGALGRPVHILLRVEPDWRWLARETDTVWYPTARLFRQRISGDWSEPMALIAADIVAWISKEERLPSMDDMPKVSLSFGELAEQIANLSVKVKFGDGSGRDAEFKQNYLKGEWNNLIKGNKLLSSLQTEIEQTAHQIAEAERKLRAREEAGNLDREMLGLVREIRSLKQKQEDRAHRIDAIAGTELLLSVSPSETVKPVRSGNKKKA